MTIRDEAEAKKTEEKKAIATNTLVSILWKILANDKEPIAREQISEWFQKFYPEYLTTPASGLAQELDISKPLGAIIVDFEKKRGK